MIELIAFFFLLAGIVSESRDAQKQISELREEIEKLKK